MRKVTFISKGGGKLAETLGFNPCWESSQPPAKSSHSVPAGFQLERLRVTATAWRPPELAHACVLNACATAFRAAALETTARMLKSAGKVGIES